MKYRKAEKCFSKKIELPEKGARFFYFNELRISLTMSSADMSGLMQ